MNHTRERHMRGDDVAKIHSLMRKGYTAREVSEIAGRSFSSVSNYFLVISEIISGKPVHLMPNRYSVDAVKEWCKSTGKEYVTCQDETPVGTGRTLADVAEDLSTLFHEFAEMWRCGK